MKSFDYGKILCWFFIKKKVHINYEIMINQQYILKNEEWLCGFSLLSIRKNILGTEKKEGHSLNDEWMYDLIVPIFFRNSTIFDEPQGSIRIAISFSD